MNHPNRQRTVLFFSLLNVVDVVHKDLTDEQMEWVLAKFVDSVCNVRKLDREKVKAEIDRWTSLDG